MENLVLCGVALLLCPLYGFLALSVVSLIDEGVKIPVWMDKVTEFFFFDLFLLAPILIYVIDASVFGLLPGLIILLIQELFSFAFGVLVLWMTIIVLQTETAFVKIKKATKVFWNKQYQLI